MYGGEKLKNFYFKLKNHVSQFVFDREGEAVNCDSIINGNAIIRALIDLGWILQLRAFRVRKPKLHDALLLRQTLCRGLAQWLGKAPLS